MADTSSEMNTPSSKRFCEHCKVYVSKNVYYRHKRLYYNKKEEKWSSSRVFYTTVEDTDASGISSSLSPLSPTANEDTFLGSIHEGE